MREPPMKAKPIKSRRERQNTEEQSSPEHRPTTTLQGSPREAPETTADEPSVQKHDLEKLAKLPEMQAYALKKLSESTGVQDPRLAVRMLDQVTRVQAPW